MTAEVRLAVNPRAARRDAAYSAAVLTREGFDAAAREIASWPGHAAKIGRAHV